MRKLQTTLTVILILIAAFLWAAKPTQATRRESGPALSAPVARALTLEEALDLSLSLGDGRQVNFAPFGLGGVRDANSPLHGI